jgi:hypothetical protein
VQDVRVSVLIVLSEIGSMVLVFANILTVNVTVLKVPVVPSTFSQVLPVIATLPFAVQLMKNPLYANTVEEPGALVIASI